jgi:hypothetical protein
VLLRQADSEEPGVALKRGSVGRLARPHDSQLRTPLLRRSMASGGHAFARRRHDAPRTGGGVGRCKEAQKSATSDSRSPEKAPQAQQREGSVT